jgi:hypothetical protein
MRLICDTWFIIYSFILRFHITKFCDSYYHILKLNVKFNVGLL